MKILYAAFFAYTLSICTAFAQNAYPGIESDTLKGEEGNLYILNKERTRVKAINNEGKILWDTNPADDANVPRYYKFISGSEREIVFFKLQEERYIKKLAIIIGYSNTQFGYIDLNTGKFHFVGQD